VYGLSFRKKTAGTTPRMRKKDENSLNDGFDYRSRDGLTERRCRVARGFGLYYGQCYEGESQANQMIWRKS